MVIEPIFDSSATQPHTRVSGCVIAYQEEDRIGDCVRSLAFCDEVVVIDSGSKDRTREIAAELGARVIDNAPFPGHREQKQFAIEQAKYDYVFCLDADERATPALQKQIVALAARTLDAAAYEMPRQNHYLGRIVRRGLFWPDRKIRLFDRRRAKWGGTNPHDHVEVQDESPVVRLAEAIEHLSFRDFAHHVRTARSFSLIAARALAAKGRHCNPFDLLVRPPAVFVKSLLVKRGFLDGWRGFVIAAMAAYTDWLKYWQLFRLPRDGGVS
ncbi:MAG: glycosyltransferase family 2 protein [Planctomycetes bacterium]|nr:glycosyltransferase family 2 protein [Planctomycetota bacterium]